MLQIQSQTRWRREQAESAEDCRVGVTIALAIGVEGFLKRRSIRSEFADGLSGPTQLVNGVLVVAVGHRARPTGKGRLAGHGRDPHVRL